MSVKLYSETKKNNLVLSNRQVDILVLLLCYASCNFPDINDAFWDDEEDLLKMGENYMPELNEVEIKNLTDLIDNLPD